MATQTIQGYSLLLRAVHWSTAAIIVALLAIGWSMTGLDGLPPATRAGLYALHKSLGVLVLVLTGFRILWRIGHMAPPLPPTLRPWELVAVRVVHGLLYVLLVAQPLVGWSLYTLSSHKSAFFGLFPIPDLPFPLPADPALWRGSLADLHGVLAGLFAVLLVAHAGAAVKHHFVARDDVLLHMAPQTLEGVLRRLRGER